MDKHIRQNGYMLTELLVGIILLLLVAAMAATQWRWHKNEQYVHSLAREVVMELQWVQHSSIGNKPRNDTRWRVMIQNEKYMVARGIQLYKERYFDDKAYILGTGNEYSFDELGRPKGNSDMHLYVYSRDRRIRYKVVIAAQTGRIRMEKD